MPTLPVAGRVVGRERIDSIGVIAYTLGNGVKVWVKPTTFKNDEILFAAFSQGGTSLYPDSLLQNKEPVTGVLKLKERLTAVTTQSVQQAAQQFINDKNYIRLVLMPEP